MGEWTDMQCRKQALLGKHLVSKNLYLQITSPTSKSWIFKYTLNKRVREMGLGSYPDTKLTDARDLVVKYRLMVRQGVDPISARRAERAGAAKGMTFEDCAKKYIDAHKGNWKSIKHQTQWPNTLATYAYPIIGSKDINDVAKADILAVLNPIWSTKLETATRVKGRISKILDWAAANDYRAEKEARLWEQVKAALPHLKKAVKHHPFCPYTEIGSFLRKVKASGADENVKLAIEFIILTGSRTGEVRLAEWSEINFDEKVRLIPANKMKVPKDHWTPLSQRAIEILLLLKSNGSKYIFTNSRSEPYSTGTFMGALNRLDCTFDIHGFRSSFRTWIGEKTNFSSHVGEAALAHSNPNKVEASYLRMQDLAQQTALMSQWAEYISLQ
jgi:integrase